MPGTLSRATQIVYRMCPRLASDEETLVFMASGEVTLTTKEGKHQVKLPESAFQEVLERLEQYSFKSITGVHGDAMADYIHEVEVHEGPKKKARCTLRFNHEFGTLIGQAPTGIKETITLLSRLAEKLTHGIGRDEALDTLLIELGRGIDFPYINPHGGPGAFILLDPLEQQRRVTSWGRVLATACRSGRIASLQVMERTLPDSGKGLAEWWSQHGHQDEGQRQADPQAVHRTRPPPGSDSPRHAPSGCRWDGPGPSRFSCGGS